MSRIRTRAEACALLGVADDVSATSLRAVYRKLVQKHHPDKGDGNEEKFLMIQEAYHLLKTGAVITTVPPPPPFVTPTKGDDTHIFCLATPDSFWNPKQHRLKVQAVVAKSCPMCQGEIAQCRQCSGTGQIFHTCSWQVTLPLQFVPFSQLRLAQQGHEGPRFTQAGDIWLTVKTKSKYGWEWSLAHRAWIFRAQRHRQGWRYRDPEGRWQILPTPADPYHSHVLEHPFQGAAKFLLIPPKSTLKSRIKKQWLLWKQKWTEWKENRDT